MLGQVKSVCRSQATVVILSDVAGLPQFQSCRPIRLVRNLAGGLDCRSAAEPLGSTLGSCPARGNARYQAAYPTRRIVGMVTLSDILRRGFRTPEAFADALAFVFDEPMLSGDLLSRGMPTAEFREVMQRLDRSDLEEVWFAHSNRLRLRAPMSRGHMPSAQILPGLHAFSQLRADNLAHRSAIRVAQFSLAGGMTAYQSANDSIMGRMLALARHEVQGRHPRDVHPVAGPRHTDIDAFPGVAPEICWNFVLRLRHEAETAETGVSLPLNYNYAAANRQIGPTNRDFFGNRRVVVQDFDLELFKVQNFADQVLPVGALLVFIGAGGIRGHFGIYAGQNSCVGKNHPTGAGAGSVSLACPSLASRYDSVEAMVPW